ncbi:TonB-dependent receptor [Pseudoteredinibacter isoporae]|uniref:Outer membrane receptor protein involved in Fe transport n=1 Tax=Pseudoteredinibacter isoporae TaxID=570281 RepID=A0A7X0JS09_9GAMM|nr:TonB-dependent receptor [Pseudoteredinibacter isoporae]MBB6520345.1 outer membrane receptor protein involved in Fe transport [Pseudoteredinibacter isoporae]NHO85915.1 TonB-dependent receptor [Pseudoteredinibacter isoporae]NIB25633.1 TonB-dependent receptor [Pseudoteredinibacter isoporae]
MHLTKLSKAIALTAVPGGLFLGFSNGSAADTNAELEEMTVYGRHNQLILESGTATKSNMQLIETPAAIVVVDRALLDAQAATTLQESLRNVSGLAQAGNNYGIGDNLQIRGLGVNYVYDGMYAGADLGNSYNPTRSTTNVESIEVLKGPATGLYGIGSAGGVINMIEKKPEFEPSLKTRASVGRWGHYNLMLDSTDALSENTAYRLVVNREEEDGFRDLGSERSEVYGSLKFVASDQHSLLLSAAYIDDSVQVDSIGDPVRIVSWDSVGVTPTLIGPDLLPNDNDSDGDGVVGLQLTDEQRAQLAASIGAEDGLRPYDLGSGSLISPLSRPNEGKESRIKLRHDWTISDNSLLTQQLLYRDYDSEFVRQTGAFNYVYWNRRGEINLNPRAPLIVDGELYPFAARRQEYRKVESEEKTWQYFADLKHEWQSGWIRGEHLLSVNYEQRDMALKSWSIYDADGNPNGNAVPYILDIRQANWGAGRFEDYSPTLRSNYDKEVSAYGISFQEVVYFTEKLTGRIGVAYSRIKQTYQHKGTDRSPGEGEEADTNDSGSSYNVGLNYRVTPQLAAFVNASQGRTAYSILGSINGQNDRPDSESKSLDVGMRFTAFDEDLLASLVWFETRRTNLRYNNPDFNDNPNDPEYNVNVPRYFFDDEDNTKGWEFDLNMALNDQFSVNLNGTYQKAIQIRSGSRSGQRKGIPKKFASLWGTYHHDIADGTLETSVGVRYVSERSINSVSFGLPVSELESYTSYDAAISYELKKIKLSLNVENLTDERYYEKAMFLGGLPANSRNVKLTVDYEF